MGLTNKRRVFIEEYLKCWNATEAARLAGYKNPNKMGPRLVKVGIVQDSIQRRLDEKAMGANEVIARLGDHARGSMEFFIDPGVPGGMLDLEKAARLGLLHLIKSVSWTRQGVKIELYDAQSALVHLGRHHGVFTDRVEYSWRDEARKAGVDPDAVYSQLVDEFTSAMVADSDAGGGTGGDTSGDPGE
jgi:hypothetical protein